MLVSQHVGESACWLTDGGPSDDKEINSDQLSQDTQLYSSRPLQNMTFPPAVHLPLFPQALQLFSSQMLAVAM